MPMYKKRSPDVFPAAFHEAFRAGYRFLLENPDAYFIDVWVQPLFKPDERDEKGRDIANIARKKIGAFKTMINLHRGHGLNEVIERCDIRTRLQKGSLGTKLMLTFHRKYNWQSEVNHALGRKEGMSDFY